MGDDREEIARLIHFMHGDGLSAEDAMKPTNDAHWDFWKDHPLHADAWKCADAILARAQGSGPTSPCYECGTDNLIGPICGGCNPEIAAMVDGGPGPGDAVAWRYRHVPYVGWSYASTKPLRSDLEVEPLYAATPTREA
jgi:hypothetical protein